MTRPTLNYKKCSYCNRRASLIRFPEHIQNPLPLKKNICIDCKATNEDLKYAEWRESKLSKRTKYTHDYFLKNPDKKTKLAAYVFQKNLAAFEAKTELYCTFCVSHKPRSEFSGSNLEYKKHTRGNMRCCDECIRIGRNTDEWRRREANRKAKARTQKRKAKNAKKTLFIKESQCRDYLLKHIPDSQCEVPNSAGIIDLLTPKRLIEIKDTAGWKSALGQLLAYKFAHENDLSSDWPHKLTVVLFKLPKAGVDIDLMFSTFKHYNIDVFTTWSEVDDPHYFQLLVEAESNNG